MEIIITLNGLNSSLSCHLSPLSQRVGVRRSRSLPLFPIFIQFLLNKIFLDKMNKIQAAWTPPATINLGKIIFVPQAIVYIFL
jgi:hypothetical protein